MSCNYVVFIIFTSSDINECDTTPGMCGPRGVCVNTEGSVRCDCNRGYTFNEDISACVGEYLHMLCCFSQQKLHKF